MGDDYQPVACGFHDQLTLWVMHGQTCAVRYRGESGAEGAARQRLVDVLTRAWAEYLRLADGT